MLSWGREQEKLGDPLFTTLRVRLDIIPAVDRRFTVQEIRNDPIRFPMRRSGRRSRSFRHTSQLLGRVIQQPELDATVKARGLVNHHAADLKQTFVHLEHDHANVLPAAGLARHVVQEDDFGAANAVDPLLRQRVDTSVWIAGELRGDGLSRWVVRKLVDGDFAVVVELVR